MLSVLCNLYVFVIMRLLLSWKIFCFDFSIPIYVSMFSRRESVKFIKERDENLLQAHYRLKCPSVCLSVRCNVSIMNGTK